MKILDKVYMLQNGEFHFGHLKIDGKFIKEVSHYPFDGNESFHGEYEYYDLSGMLVIPGFVNTHTHSPMIAFRGMEDFAPLSKWLKKVMKEEEKLDSEMIYWFSLLAQMEMSSKGITIFGDMYFHLGSIAKAVNEFGMKALLTRGLVDVDENGRKRLDENIKNLSLSDERIRIGLGPHAPYTCSKNYLKEISDVAKTDNLKVMIHLLESPNERGMYILSDLVETGIFETDLIGVHLVQVEKEDLIILKENDVGISLCPVSNAKLRNGFPPIDEMMNLNLRLSVGTDGAASNNSLDVWKELNYTALTSRILNKEFDVYKFFLESFENGAKILGFDNTGRIEEGFHADLVVIDSTRAEYFPTLKERMLSHLIFSGNSGDVFATMVDGVWIYYDGSFPTVDEKEIKKNAMIHFKRLEGLV